MKFVGNSINSGSFNLSNLNLTRQDFLAAGIETGSDAIIGAALVAGAGAAFLMLPVSITLPAAIIGAAALKRLSPLVPFAPFVLPMLGRKVRGKVVDGLKSIFGDNIESSINDFYNDSAGWILDSANNFADAIRDQLRRLIDPIVLDLDGNGIELIPRATSNVYFDMDGDGIKEQTGWVKPTDGLLAIDSNANGQIDNINELIGDLGRSGFAELVTYDLNNDRVINASDAVWSQFRVWLDANSNGLTDAGELRTLASLNIRSIDLRYTAVNFTAEGNRIHEQSIFEYTNGTTGLVADIWFDVSNVDTNSSISLTGNITIDNLPDIRGRGDVKSLRLVMLTDGALATLVTGFVSQNLSSLANARSQAEQIIYRWAGVQSVDPSSRGGLFDGRKLAALEAFLGTQFVVEGIRNPNAQAVASLTASWNGLVDGILARLLMSGPLGSAMADSAVYVPEIDRLMTVQTPADLLNSFKSKAPAGDGITVAGYWAAVLPLAREIIQDVGGDPTSTSFTTAVNAALENTGLAPFADLLTNGIIPLSPIPSVLQSAGVFRLTSGNDTLWLGTDRYAVFAGDGNDFLAFTTDNSQPQHLDGGAGNDQIYGTAANDWLDGGAGADTMAGAGGDDTYTVDNAGDVITELASGGEDHVRSSITYTLSSNLEHLTLLGTTAINGTGNASANRLSGNSAANRLEGLAGNDTLDGGAGADTLNGGLGADLYRVDDIGDVILETGSDIDTVEASLNYTLGARVENLVLIGTALNGTGNEANNSIWGNALNNTLNGAASADTMIGGLGNDTYIVDNSGDSVQEEESAGTDRVQSSISYTLGWNVEHLVLTGSQDLSGTGNDLANQITGNSGDNWIDGGQGADTMSGGGGDDGYVVDNAGDVVTEAANAGIDWVYSTRSAYTLGANVENLQLYISWDDGINRNGTGNTLDNEIIGTSGSNILTALAGNDSLYGQGGTDSLYGGDGDDLLNGGSEQDRLEGGAGNDRYIVDLATDTVIEALNAGSDTVESSVSWILGANVEHLTLTGEWNAIDGQGNGLNNQLTGNNGNNNLDGSAGADTMAGAGGDDTYTVDNAGDVITELASGGEDHVRSSITYTLSSNLEHLTLLGTTAINGTGNASANRLSGNSAANRLEGLAGNDTLDGGAGADTLNGGLGADLYRVDDIGDVILETGSDIDTVEASLNYTLGARVENLVLIGTALNGTGNEANNSIWGNALNNTLNGAASADTMIGGLGNDTYIVDNSGDSVQEEESAGTDRVQSSISYTLGWNVEHLVLTGSQDLSGTGNDLANQITGNSGDNWIDGGQGADTMSGGGGDDGYVVDNAGDVVTEAANAGIDWVYSTRSAYTLGANVENLQLYISWDDGINRNGTGNTLDNEIIGTSGSNILTALAGNDSLYGQGGTDSLYGGDGDDLLNGGSEQDRLEGGAGNDRYIVDLATDTVIEALNAGSDTVESSVSWILGANVEHLTLTGEWNAIDGQGNGLNNQLTGNNGNNNLDGSAGADTMAGAGGDDTYTVDNAGDVVFELPTSGTDHVRSSITYALGAFVENLTLLGSGNINATGNTLANTISGNAGHNTISGGLGKDTLTGNTGSDTFRFQTIEDSANFEDTADIITDFSLAQGDRIDISGIDAVASSVADNAFVFIGSSAFSAAGQVRFFASSGMTYVSLNTNSDLNNVELMIALTGQLTMQQSHFLL
jgi:Ca2+-binding RTX toxin-like protein